MDVSYRRINQTGDYTMKECRFQLTYIADGQLHRTCGKAQEQQPFETEHFSS